MTTEEIKTLIDQKIAGQGSMVDVGGALPTILKEIVDMASQGGGGGDIKPIILSEEPTGAITTQAELEAIGLTTSEIIATKEGKRTMVVSPYNIFQITNVYIDSNDDSETRIAFYTFAFNESGEISECYGFDISTGHGTATVTESHL